MLKSTVKALLRLLPYTRTGDFLYTLTFFLYAHRRWPRRDSGLLNDYLFFLRNSPEMADALRQITSDKVYAKLFIDQIAGRKVTPETYAVFDSVDRIDRRALPDRCILKAAHASGCVVFLDGAEADLTEADREQLRRGLACDVYRAHREINYKYLRKRIICEELLDTAEHIKDYKFFYYKGSLKFVQVDTERHRDHKQSFYDSDWNNIHVTYNNNPAGELEPPPDALSEMDLIGQLIAQYFESVRIDYYLKDGEPFVGEITHCHNQGLGSFANIEEEKLISRIYFGTAD